VSLCSPEFRCRQHSPPVNPPPSLSLSHGSRAEPLRRLCRSRATHRTLPLCNR
jgi:hypothetical protein